MYLKKQIFPSSPNELSDDSSALRYFFLLWGLIYKECWSSDFTEGEY